MSRMLLQYLPIKHISFNIEEDSNNEQQDGHFDRPVSDANK